MSLPRKSDAEIYRQLATVMKPMEQFGQAVVSWAAEWGPKMEAALVADMERLARATRPLVDAVEDAYREAGAPYGDSEEGMLRWLSDQSSAANERWRREKEESIRETCEMLRSRPR